MAPIPPTELFDDVGRAMARESLVDFIRMVAPWFQIEAVHIAICLHIEALVRGEFTRLMIHTAPRTGKSQIVSVFARAWVMGKFPSMKLLNASHSKDLAEGFANETLAVMATPAYREIFPEIEIIKNAARRIRWRSIKDRGVELGDAGSVGAEKKIAGYGFNFGTLDDILSEQDWMSDKIKDRLFDWYRNGFYPRRQLDWNIILIMATRWCWDDPPGRILEMAKETGEHWEILSIPAVLDRKSYRVLTHVGNSDPTFKRQKNKLALHPGGSFMPGRMSMKEIKSSEATTTNYDAQYLQTPSKAGGMIFRKDMFSPWPEKKELPTIELGISFYDTAFEEKEINSYTARITAGVFSHKAVDPVSRTEHIARKLVILEADQQHMEAKDLLQECTDNHFHWRNEVATHLTVIEKKASGIQLVQDLKQARIPVLGWLPNDLRLGMRDKISRAKISSIHVSMGDIFLYGDGDWQEMFYTEITGFPQRQHDDLVDAFTMAVLFFRRHFLFNVPLDMEREEERKERILQPPKVRQTLPRTYGRL